MKADWLKKFYFTKISGKCFSLESIYFTWSLYLKCIFAVHVYSLKCYS